MIFWIFVILCLVFFVLYAKSDNWWDSDTYGVFAFICLGISLFMLFPIVANLVTAKAETALLNETHTALVYKMESTTCRDEFGFLSKDIIDDVQEWNETIRENQALQDDFWIGIFVPNIYDEFQLIDYESYNRG